MSDTLMHYGVKGMRRGARKSREERNAERRAKYEAKLKAKYGIDDVGKIESYLKKRKEHAEKVKNWRLANQRNRQLTATERREKYYGELDRGKLGKTYSTDATLAEAARKFYKKGHNKRMSHSELMHFGVKGMKWGVRRRDRRDAKEFTQANMYYGEGAGNRRKLIKARSKDPFYKSEFDKAVANTDMSKRASQARRQRGRKNARNASGKTVRGVGNIATGNVSRAGGALALGYLGYQAAKRTGHAPSEAELLRKAARGARKIKRVVQHDDVLAHHGVKGMRWGVRKQRIKDAKRWTSKKQAKIDGMSDDQLRRINNRIRLEKEYRQLTQTRMERYRSKTGKAAEEAAFNTLQNVIQKGLKKAASQGGSAAIKGAKRFKHSETGMSSNIFFIDEDEVLAHHGVKGMRWGVRKQRPSGGAGPAKKRKGLSRKQKAAIAGVLGTAAAVGGGYYLHKSGNGKKIAALAKKQGAAAKKFTQGKGRNLGAQARVKKAQAKRFVKAQSANAKGAAEKYAEATRLGANAAKFKAGAAARSAGYKAKNQAWKAGNKARKAATGGASGVKSAAGSAARAAKSKFGKKAPSKALSTAVRSGGAGRRKLAVSGTKVVGRGDKTLAKNLAKIGAVGVGAHATGVVAGRAAAKAAGKKLESTGKRRRAQKRR